MSKNRPNSKDFQWPHRMLAALVLLFAPAALSAQTAQAFENLDGLDSLVAMTVGADLGQPGGPVAPIDRRLRLKPCPSTPKIDGPTFGAAIVSCAETGWRIRVPLVPVADPAKNLAAAAVRTAPAAVAAPVTKEAVVKKGDPVELIAGSELFSVSRVMVADEDGAIGAMIRVRQDPKSPPVVARVEKAGVVRAPTI